MVRTVAQNTYPSPTDQNARLISHRSCTVKTRESGTHQAISCRLLGT